MAVWNPAKGKRERVGRLVQMRADKRDEINECCAGDICAVVGLKLTTTGDTLCDEHHPIVLERMEFPEPVIDIAIEPKTKADQDKLGTSLQKLAIGGPVLPGADRSRERADADRRHGRAASGDHRRPPAARVQGRGQRRQAAGRVPRDHHPAGGGARAVHPAVGGARAVRRHRARLSPNESGKGFSSKSSIAGREGAEGVRRGGVPGSRGGDEQRAARGLPDGGRGGGGDRRELPRRGLERGRLPHRRLDGVPRRGARPGRCCSSRSCPSRW